MKKLFLFHSVIFLLAVSCSENNIEDNGTFEERNISKVIEPKNNDIFISQRSKSIEKTRSIFLKNRNLLVKPPFLSKRSSDQTLTSDQIIVTIPQKTFIGAVFNGNTIDNLSYSVISNPVDPITISYSFPSDFLVDTIERPSLSKMRSSVYKAMRSSNFSGEQSLAFDYSIREYSYYSQLKLAFGSNINIGKILNIDISGDNNKIKSKTGVFAKFTQKNFTMDMDLPIDGNIFLNNSELELLKDKSPIYISSITFGRLGVVSIQSEYSYEKVSVALKASLNARIVNGKLDIGSENEKIMRESEITTYILGGNGQQAAQVVKGFDKFTEFIVNGGEFTPNVPGVPIYFTASYASDNSVFYTKFDLN